MTSESRPDISKLRWGSMLLKAVPMYVLMQWSDYLVEEELHKLAACKVLFSRTIPPGRLERFKTLHKLIEFINCQESGHTMRDLMEALATIEQFELYDRICLSSEYFAPSILSSFVSK